MGFCFGCDGHFKTAGKISMMPEPKKIIHRGLLQPYCLVLSTVVITSTHSGLMAPDLYLAEDPTVQ